MPKCWGRHGTVQGVRGMAAHELRGIEDCPGGQVALHCLQNVFLIVKVLLRIPQRLRFVKISKQD